MRGGFWVPTIEAVMWEDFLDLTESVNRRWRVLCRTAQQAVDGLIWWGQVREDLQDVLCPFQKWQSISLPELVAMSERVRTWRYI